MNHLLAYLPLLLGIILSIGNIMDTERSHTIAIRITYALITSFVIGLII